MPSGTYSILSLMRKTNNKLLYLARCEQTGQQVVLCKLLERTEIYNQLLPLSHKNLVRVLDVEIQSNELTYVILEYIEAPLLSDTMKQKLTQRAILNIGIQLCAALHALHSIGLVHRDIKPENIFLLPDGTVKLFDYDTSRVFKSSTDSDTTPMGTFGYAAPEQFGLKQTDARSDIYALGILLNMLATGKHPSVQLCKGVLHPIVLRCTHVSPEKRYRNAMQVQRALRTCLMCSTWAVPMTAALMALLVLTLLPKPAQEAPQTPPSALPSPTYPAAAASTTPTPGASDAPVPTPSQLPQPTIPDLPAGFEPGMSSTQQITLNGNSYYLYLCADEEEQFAPRTDEATHQVFLSESDKLTFYLYFLPVDGDMSKIEAFRNQVLNISYELTAQNSSFDTSITMDGFGFYPDESTNILGRGRFIGDPHPAYANNRPIHHLLKVSVDFKNNSTHTLYLSATLCQEEVTLTPSSRYPMDTTASLNALLDALDELFGPDTAITLELPAQEYPDMVIIPNRSVTLIGAAEGTVFSGGLIIDDSTDSKMINLNNIIFQGSGNGTAIASQRSISLRDCTFNDYASCYTVSSKATVTGSSITGNVPFTERRRAHEPDLTTAAGLNAYLANLPEELAKLPSFTIQLPNVVYTEEVVIDRAVSLKGTPTRKTTFLAGVRYTGQGEEATISECTFICNDLEAAVSSSRDLMITDCNFRGFTYAAMPIGDAEIGFLDCNFDNTDNLVPDWPLS